MVGIDELLGKSVIGTWGNHVGEVTGLDIDTTTWKVTHLQLKLSNIATKEIGLKKVFKAPTIRIPTTFVDKIGVIITLNQSIVDLKNNQDYSVIESP